VDVDNQLRGNTTAIGAFRWGKETATRISRPKDAEAVSPQLVSRIWPNPSSSLVRIDGLALTVTAVVIYNNEGKIVRMLNRPTCQPTISWDKKDESGNILQNGLYYITVRSPQQSSIIPVLLVK
jgi:hypothetical protein